LTFGGAGHVALVGGCHTKPQVRQVELHGSMLPQVSQAFRLDEALLQAVSQEKWQTRRFRKESKTSELTKACC
ncbi:MAG: hypothetical protein Q7T39_25875, partial [Polaromonas sp.]|nr:hypothetical protein [Polaromonas sp.]